MYNKPEKPIDKEIWQQYKATGDAALRDMLILHYSYVVKYTVMQLRGSFKNLAEQDDLISEGLIALMDAVEKFDTARDVKFETYASIRVRGSIIDYIRKQDWVPRRVRKNAKDIENATTALWANNDRHPTDEELAEYLNISVDELHSNIAQSYSASILSFEEIVQESMTGAESEISLRQSSDSDMPEASLFTKELREVLVATIEKLPPKEKLVVAMYYYENLKLKEIATVMEVSESRVCQMHTSAIAKLKKTIGEYIQD